MVNMIIRIIAAASLSLSLAAVPSIAAAQSQPNRNQARIAEIHIALLDRLPTSDEDQHYLALLNQGLGITALADLIKEGSDARALYPSLVTRMNLNHFVSAVYVHIHGRAPDAEVEYFWTELLETQRVTEGEFIIQLIDATSPAERKILNDRMGMK